MATRYGINSKRVSSDDVSTASVTSMTITSQGNDAKGGYYMTAYVNASPTGCLIGPAMSILIKNEALPGWKRITFKSYMAFKCSCWYLNESSYHNNLSTFSLASGDLMLKSVNCFELPQFTIQTSACDNNSTNAFHASYAVGTYREWFQKRRRNDVTSEAGPGALFGCLSVQGPSAILTISDIYIYM